MGTLDDDGGGKDELGELEVVLETKNDPTTSGVWSLSPPYFTTIS
jgi:hypothetical protein